eukprot:TRINITY_DN4959_c0_g1_i1.p1 TRINITY_DN4959_c0_g1~~TRINITY_DN4959_c0_g1_i1.p1  ORF type:complete len:102 (+),score=3.88 TRINITY_DN4959_c0_g1_i1:194-499(+)
MMHHSLVKTHPFKVRGQYLYGSFLLTQIEDKEWKEAVYGEEEDHNSLSSVGEYGLDRLVEAVTSQHVLPGIYQKLGIVNDANLQKTADNKYWKNANWRARL